MKKWNRNIPGGTRDRIFEECLFAGRLQERLSALYSSLGYRRIMTPHIEFYDVFDIKNRFMPQEIMYKLTDGDGRLIVLRPDSTPPLARVAATGLRDHPRPLKLFYSQSVFRVHSGYTGKSCEVAQSGVELIGDGSIKSDIVCLQSAFTSLQSIEELGGEYVIEIGHIGFFKALIENLTLGEEEQSRLLECVAAKDTSSLDFLDSENEGYRKAKEILTTLPRLYGGEEVFDRARELAAGNQKALSILDYLYQIFSALRTAGYGDRITADLGIAHEIDYYTGIVFRGYALGAGEPVLTGGRYDELIENFGVPEPAVGFAVNMDLIAEAAAKRSPPPVCPVPEVLIHFEADALGAAFGYLQTRGVSRYELSTAADPEDSAAYARLRGIPLLVTVDNQTIKEETVL